MNKNIVAQDEQKVKPELPAARRCCICADPFVPGDEAQVLCPGCEARGYACGCVMPWQSCAVCEAVARIIHGSELPF